MNVIWSGMVAKGKSIVPSVPSPVMLTICRGEIQNFVGIHPAYTQAEDGQGSFGIGLVSLRWTQLTHRHSRLQARVAPRIQPLPPRTCEDTQVRIYLMTQISELLTLDCRLSEDVKCWSLFVHNPLRTWIHGKVILIGDAAHPVFQKTNSSIITNGGAN
jgi:hypothetical protein